MSEPLISKEQMEEYKTLLVEDPTAAANLRIRFPGIEQLILEDVKQQLLS